MTELGPVDRQVEMDPRMSELFKLIGRALVTNSATDWIDAKNMLQDMEDERSDYLRGPGHSDGAYSNDQA